MRQSPSLDARARSTGAHPPLGSVLGIRAANACLVCDQLTWSRQRLCRACRRAGRRPSAASGPAPSEAVSIVLCELPYDVAGRFVSRSLRTRYHLPTAVLGLAIYLVWLFTLALSGAMALLLVGAALMALELEFLLELFVPLAVLLFTLLILLGPVFAAGDGLDRLRMRAVHDQLLIREREVRVRTCPSCTYDLAGSPGASCSECGGRIAFAIEPAAPSGIAGGDR